MPGLNDLIPYVKPGDKILASTENDMRRRLNALGNTGDDVHVLANAAGKFFGRSGKRPIEPDLIWVRNDTGGDLTAEHPVVGIGDPVRTPAESEAIVHRFPPAVSGETPTADHTGKFAILLGPVSADGWQLGIISGVAWVRARIEDEDHETADVDENETDRLVTASGGAAQILFKGADEDLDPDVRWLLVRFSPSSECACEEVHEFSTTGTLTGGTWSMDYTINGVSNTISSIDDATTAAQLQTKIEGHAEVLPGDVLCFGGNFPDTAIYCKFIGNLASTNIPLPAPNSGSLTGTAPRVKVRKASAYEWS